MKYLDGTPDYPTLSYYRVDPHAIPPVWGTEDAACFDVAACLPAMTDVKIYTPENTYRIATVHSADEPLFIQSAERAMIPTGLIFDIPTGYELKFYSRSGVALKVGLNLINSVAVIDFGYVMQSYLLVMNNSTVPVAVTHGDRIAQAQMRRDYTYGLKETFEMPQQKTDRNGGLGSTGFSHKK